ncbi:unnamed protein product [Rotaria sordida]|uniref:Uncharacterized protein n=2 Tax=Rotaria sordida TaxID=392033 RepID=A0A816B4E3_9BILA|nr:unnamed protein product [Rotaria sordida]
MQGGQTNEKMVTVDVPNIAVPIKLALLKDHQIQRTRRTFSVILGVLIGLGVFATIVSFYGSNNDICLLTPRRVPKTIEYLMSIIFCIFGFHVAHRYSTIGLRVFAWLIIFELVIDGIMIIVFFHIGATASHARNSNVYRQSEARISYTSPNAFLCALIYIFDFIFDIIIVRLAFKLAKLIEIRKSSIIQQI